MLTDFEQKIAGFIEANGLFEPADKILLAVSGGADSTSLLYTMWALKAEGLLDAELLCAHINHQIRGAEADLDEKFAALQARELNLAITTKRVNTPRFARRNKLSIETAGRKLRMETLLDIAREKDCEYIATAHQKNDNAETILQRLARGTGFRGLGGIWPMRKFEDDVFFVRPLLCVSRDEIIEYLKEQNIGWREDKTNADCRYRRNYIRHRLLPQLQKESSGSVVEELSELAESARRLQKSIGGFVDEVWGRLAVCGGGKVTLDLGEFSNLAEPVKVEALRRSLIVLGSGERDLTNEHFKRILEMAQQNVSGRKIELPGGYLVWREYRKLVFGGAEKTQADERISESIKVNVPGQTRFGRFLVEAGIFEAETGAGRYKAGKTSFVEWFDLAKVKLPLSVRCRRAGDRFIPLGQAEEKKVGKFLTAQRVPQRIRKRVLVVADGEKIIWVWPIRICEQAKITEKTQKILRLQITDSE